MRWALISAPLLGTGAGGVPHVPAVEALTVGFRNQAPSDATLSLCVLHKAVFKRLEARFSRSFVVRAQPSRVFSCTTSLDGDSR